jgi:hypothetical protein
METQNLNKINNNINHKNINHKINRTRRSKRKHKKINRDIENSNVNKRSENPIMKLEPKQNLNIIHKKSNVYNEKSNGEIYEPLENLALAAEDRYQYEKSKDNNDGYWVNIFNFLRSFKKYEENKYPLIIHKDYNGFPSFYNSTIEYKYNDTVEIIEWKNREVYNIIHYKFINTKYFQELCKRKLQLFIEKESRYLNSNILEDDE